MNLKPKSTGFQHKPSFSSSKNLNIPNDRIDTCYYLENLEYFIQILIKCLRPLKKIHFDFPTISKVPVEMNKQ